MLEEDIMQLVEKAYNDGWELGYANLDESFDYYAEEENLEQLISDLLE